MTVAGRRPPSRWSWRRALGAVWIVSGRSMAGWYDRRPSVRARYDPTERADGREPRGGTMSARWTASSHGVRWTVELERDRLLPGRLVAGSVDVAADDRLEARALEVALVATEWWQHEESSTD